MQRLNSFYISIFTQFPWYLILNNIKFEDKNMTFYYPFCDIFV